MDKTEQQIAYSHLIIKHLKGSLSEAEDKLLQAWLLEDETNRKLFERLSNVGAWQDELLFFDEIDTDKAFARLLPTIREDVPVTPVFSIRYFLHKWGAVAAALLIVVLATVVLYIQKNNNAPSVEVVSQTNAITDVLPGSNKAILTLSNGSHIILDTAHKGDLVREGKVQIVKTGNGELAYRSAAGNTGAILYNTISTPRGGQYKLILPDGSRVWLNAASSIRFPTAFSGNKRAVDISGEAYFEIEKDARAPFTIHFTNASGNASEIEVLGTHFNVNAYTDEPVQQTSLIEGSIRFKSPGKEQVLTPGQTATLQDNQLKINTTLRVEEAIAWKNGYFQFNNTSLPAIMRQVSRWYDVETEFDGNLTETEGFTGKISKELPLSRLLEILHISNVKIERRGKQIVIKL